MDEQRYEGTTARMEGQRSAKDRVLVLFIAGTGRSGSTLLSNILGQVDGLWSVGELRHFWQRGIIENWRCGCGLSFDQCSIWSQIIDEAFDTGGIDAHAVVRAERRLMRVRHIPLVLLSRHRPELIDRRMGDYRSMLDRLYRSVRSVTGAQVIVDSSKTPTYGYVLKTIPSIDLRVVHLVRDPRAAAYSLSRRRPRNDAGDERSMDVMGPAKSSALWGTWNGLAEMLLSDETGGYRRIRYEDLVRDVRGSIISALDLVGRADADLPFLRLDSVQLRPTHSVSGNPVRMRHGQIDVRPDVEWASRMTEGDRAIATAVASPVMWRYGYPLSGRTRRSSPGRGSA